MVSTPTPAEPGPVPEAAAPETPTPEAFEPATPATPETPEAPEATEATEAPKPRPRGRTAKIMACAVALGVLGGAGTGYAVQAARKPTPLPPLAVTQPAYPTAHHAAAALSAADDDEVKTDGDLTKLLVPVPSGTTPWSNPRGVGGWYDLYELSSNYTHPGAEFTYQLGRGFRRAAVQTWMDGSVSYEVDLVQYRHDEEASAQEFLSDQIWYADQDTDSSVQPLTGSSASGIVVGPKLLHYPDGTGYYRGFGFAQHGDIAVLILVYSPNRIPGGPLMTLLKNQVERL